MLSARTSFAMLTIRLCTADTHYMQHLVFMRHKCSKCHADGTLGAAIGILNPPQKSILLVNYNFIPYTGNRLPLIRRYYAKKDICSRDV